VGRRRRGKATSFFASEEGMGDLKRGRRASCGQFFIGKEGGLSSLKEGSRGQEEGGVFLVFPR